MQNLQSFSSNLRRASKKLRGQKLVTFEAIPTQFHNLISKRFIEMKQNQ